MSGIRPCREDENAEILAIVNAAAEAYRGSIPADRWHEPYMAASELEGEIAAGIAFWGYEDDGALIGVMGIQPVREVAKGAELSELDEKARAWNAAVDEDGTLRLRSATEQPEQAAQEA